MIRTPSTPSLLSARLSHIKALMLDEISSWDVSGDISWGYQ
jgi:hypothetical protein